MNLRPFVKQIAPGVLAVVGMFGVLSTTTTFVHAEEPVRGGELVIGAGYSASSLNPAVQSGFGAGVPGAQLFAGLVRYDEDWNPQPYLATDWAFSADGKTLRLNLVKNATFHDGEPITASDVVFSINAVKANHPFKTMLQAVESAKAADDHTVVINLSQPHPALMVALSPLLLPIMPEHVYGDEQELRTHPRNLQDVVGSGPFKFGEYVADQRIVLDRYEDFFIEGRPYLDRIVIQTVRDRSNMSLLLQRGEVQYNPFTSLTLRDVDRLSRINGLSATTEGYGGIGAINWLAFNLDREPLKDLRVRQAIAYAIDKDFIINTMQLGRSKRATGPIADSSPFYTADVEQYDLNIERSKQLLDDAGYVPDENGVRMTITIDWIPGTVEFGKNLGEALSAQLRKVGVEATVRSLPDFGSWIGQISATSDYDLSIESLFNWGDPIIGVHRSYITSNIRPGVPFSNTTHYTNPEIDALLEQAGAETDPTERTALYHEFQKIITNDLPMHYLHEVPFHTVQRDELRDLPVGIWGAMAPFDRAYWAQ
ncbi:ABC transporter substrate-binding protein [Phaeobacter piscinae]|uniref:ABC transporter substrate-binding protein n=1 Tax=Phaeobacter piscinae TaxID=1580596 RepID=UPI00058BACB9|nr:ABC transporter substrate-binding protein [Phaeobacter piscinae]UTS82634.1 Oligopeptide-binding protein AppA [Phaeobacter piscinae]